MSIISIIFCCLITYIITRLITIRLLNLITKYRSKTHKLILKYGEVSSYYSYVMTDGKIDDELLDIGLWIPFIQVIILILTFIFYVLYLFEFLGTYIKYNMISNHNTNIRIFNISTNKLITNIHGIYKAAASFFIFDGEKYNRK